MADNAALPSVDANVRRRSQPAKGAGPRRGDVGYWHIADIPDRLSAVRLFFLSLGEGRGERWYQSACTELPAPLGDA